MHSSVAQANFTLEIGLYQHVIFQYASRDVKKYVLRNCQIVWKRNSEMSGSTEEKPWHDKNSGCKWLGVEPK